ncbi:MAG: helix-turn-helix domain-containing protein [Candidatus Saccharimonadales bacterium]
MAKGIDTIYAEIVKRLVKERKRQNITQEELARISSVDRTHMGSIEQGRRKPTLATIYKIAKVLKMPLEHLFKGM